MTDYVTIQQAAKKYGIPVATIHSRIQSEDGRSDATMTSPDRKAYHAAYCRGNRQPRLNYQRADDGEHKPEKAKRERTYKHLQRYGQNRGYVLMKNTQYRINAFLRR